MRSARRKYGFGFVARDSRASCLRDGIDGRTQYLRIHASISTLSCSHLYNVPLGSRPKHQERRPKAEFKICNHQSVSFRISRKTPSPFSFCYNGETFNGEN